MKLSPAALRICEVAAPHLAERGYDGSSLSEIAQLAGIRKASLYSHFGSKDELIAAILQIALGAERDFLRECFRLDSGALRGGEYLARIAERYESSPHFRFLLRTAYAPPHAIREEVMTLYRGYLDDVRQLFSEGLAHDDLFELQTEAYLGIVDSLQVEVVYGAAETFEPRRRALWSLLSGTTSTTPPSHLAPDSNPKEFR